MAGPSNGSIGSFVSRLGIVAAPALLVLVIVVALGVMPLGWAAAIALASSAGAALLAWSDQRERRAIAAYAGDLAELEDAMPPPATDSASEVLWAMRRLATVARQRVVEANRDRERLAAIIERLPEPLLLVDHRRRIIQANAAARALLGEQPEDQGLAGVLREPQVLAAVDAALAGRTPDELEFTIGGRQESQFLVNVAGVPGDGDGGRSAVLVLHDVTAIRAIESMRVDFVSNVSHELRTPLASLVGFIETLQGQAANDPEAREQFLAIMSEQAARMEAIVNDLLSLSRIELDERIAPTGTVDLGYVIRSVVDALSPRAEAAGATIEVRLPESGPIVVGDADQLAQVFSNLIDNALKYGGEAGPVEISASLADEGGNKPVHRVRVAVRDFGPGIAREHIPRLTERFYRVDTARSRSLGGTGLGLAIVKHVINRHQGEIRVHSEIGKGSEFAVLLPAAPDESRGTAA